MNLRSSGIMNLWSSGITNLQSYAVGNFMNEGFRNQEEAKSKMYPQKSGFDV
jgi:hypothetical protein